MDNPEKDIIEAMLAGSGLSAVELGLRFDKVVVRVLGRLRAYAETAAPVDVTALVTITAPIRVPAKTVVAIRALIEAMLATGASNDKASPVHGNAV
ncbi:MAG: hypothetical protein JSS35_04615, partial [Proteobacteria bacterium]|nr:hypothetical protein [Pseudomonadota bacterium]